ncbi:MAG TPA: GNAT family N-acetyltransferase [Thermoplasmata archaeon]|nr:GNAT family N-acetyltransferase [Thermoplasmata archaeon]
MAAQVPIVYRPLRRSDYASYQEVVQLAIGQFEKSTGLDLTAEATIAQLSRRSTWFHLGLFRLFGRPILDILVASQGPDVVGTATALWLPRAAYVAGVATRPGHRSRGIATHLLGLFTERARRRRRAWMALDVESENLGAIRVYRAAGYREVGTYTWFSRAELPRGESPTPSAVLPVGPSDWQSITARLEAGRPAEYRDAFPASEAALTHNEFLVRGGQVEFSTWKRELPGGGVAVVRAHIFPGVRLAAYFPLSSAPEASADEFVGLIDAATDWLSPQRPSRVLAVAPEPRGNAAIALERRGFAAVASTTAMVARVADGSFRG